MSYRSRNPRGQMQPLPAVRTRFGVDALSMGPRVMSAAGIRGLSNLYVGFGAPVPAALNQLKAWKGIRLLQVQCSHAAEMVPEILSRVAPGFGNFSVETRSGVSLERKCCSATKPEPISGTTVPQTS